MKDLLLDAGTHDLAVTDLDLEVVDDTRRIRQHVRQRLQLFQGEWFLDPGAGVPWLQEVLEKGADVARVESIIKATILGTPGVEELVEFGVSFDGPTRQLQIEFRVRTTDGDMVESQEVVA